MYNMSYCIFIVYYQNTRTYGNPWMTATPLGMLQHDALKEVA